jgi:hypothetical protein
MNLTNESINVQKKDLIEHAVRLLAYAEDNQTTTGIHATVALAQGYLRAAELMNDSEVTYIDLGVRTTFG